MYKVSKNPASRLASYFIVPVAVTALLSVPAVAQTILSETFEGAALDSRISLTRVGTFNLLPGVQALTNFGSAKAFGFGLSTCGANCFNSFTSQLNINFPAPIFVSTLAFKEMELYDNWGSNGIIAIDGVALTGSTLDFGRLPSNDRIPDSTFRQRAFQVNRMVSSITLSVYDITNLSQIAIDDLVVSSVPESPAWYLYGIGILALALRCRRSWASTKDA